MSILGHSTDNHSFMTKCFSLFFSLFVFLYLCLFVFVSFCLFIFLSFVYFSFCLFVFLSFCLSIFLSFCLFVFLSSCLSVFCVKMFCLFVLLPFYLFVFMSFCPSVILYLCCIFLSFLYSFFLVNWGYLPLPTSPMTYHVLIMPPKSPFTNQYYLCSMLFEKYFCVCYFSLG
jgi:hypothetical protein